jgi:hypothetical protein
MLPEGFKPAPRVTAADEDGSVDTLDRRLKDRVYLMFEDVSDDSSSLPYFPTTVVKDDESLLEAAQRALQEQVVSDAPGSVGKKKMGGNEAAGGNSSGKPFPLTLYCPSKMPIAVRLDQYGDDSSEFFGTKTFYMKVQYDDGKLTQRDIPNTKSICWLDRSEIVERMMISLSANNDNNNSSDINHSDANFYQYML